MVWTSLVLLCIAPQTTPLTTTAIAAEPARLTYAQPNRVVWRVTAPPGTEYRWRRDIRTVVASGEARSVLALPADSPGIYWLELTADGKTQRYAVAVAPDRIRPSVPPPADLDTFWARQIREIRKLPLDPVITRRAPPRPDIEYGHIEWAHRDGERVYGQWARPVSTERKRPALLFLQWAGGPYALSPWWIAQYAADGWLVLNIQPHDVPVDAGEDFYKNLPPERKNYGQIGWKNRDESYFVSMYMRGVRAVDYLRSRPDWDGRTLAVMGTSMGGQQAVAVAGLHPGVTHLFALEPAGCDLNGIIAGRQPGYPFYGTTDPAVLATAQYVDVAHLARRTRARALIGIGWVDDVTPPTGIYAMTNVLRGPVTVVPLPYAAHNHVSSPEQLRPYNEALTAALRAIVSPP